MSDGWCESWIYIVHNHEASVYCAECVKYTVVVVSIVVIRSVTDCSVVACAERNHRSVEIVERFESNRLHLQASQRILHLVVTHC